MKVLNNKAYNRLFQEVCVGIMPRSRLSANVLQSTPCLHDERAPAVLQEASLGVPQALACHPTDRVCATAADG